MITLSSEQTGPSFLCRRYLSDATNPDRENLALAEHVLFQAFFVEGGWGGGLSQVVEVSFCPSGRTVRQDKKLVLAV